MAPALRDAPADAGDERSLQQIVAHSIRQLESKLETRFNAMDKATDLLHADFTRVPTEMDRAILHLRELLQSSIRELGSVTVERFARIEVQFSERDKRTDQLALASSTAIAAALQAAKEAVGAQNTSNAIAIAKSEASTQESLKQLRDLFQSESRATNSNVAEVKSRLDKGEGVTRGGQDQRTERRLDTGSTIAMVLGGVACVGLVFAILTFALTRTNAPSALPVAPIVAPIPLQQSR